MPINGQQQTYPRHEGFMVHPQFFPDALPFRVGDVQGTGQPRLLIDNNRDERINNFVSSGQHSNVVQGIDEKIEGCGEEKETTHKRIKWTDGMAKLLITALSYIAEDDVTFQHFRCRSGGFLSYPKPGKWKAISKIMEQRGYHVSPPQCEDKFNDLNKKFRRLNNLLGRDMACNVVVNPKLIDLLDLSDEAVGEVMKILSCQHLLFREMCSYHNGNRLFLPHDPSLQNSLKLALKTKGKRSQEVIQELPAKRMRKLEDIHELPAKRMRKLEDYVVSGLRHAFDRNRKSAYHLPNEKTNQFLIPMEIGEGDKLPINCMTSRLLQLEEQKLEIQEQRLELEKLLRNSKQKDLELEKTRMENKVTRLENQRLAFKLKCWNRGADYN